MKQQGAGWAPEPKIGVHRLVLVTGGLAGTVMLICLSFAFLSLIQVSTESVVSVPGPPPESLRLQAARPAPDQAAAPGPPLADPVAVEIPSIKVSSTLERLHLNPDGTLAVPKDFNEAGWWAEGTHPGAAGPAIVVGHVDSYTGPAVFYHLGSLLPGAAIQIQLADDEVLQFTVEQVMHFPKDEFPTRAIYSPTDGSTLRLITCGGVFDRSKKSYKDNIVVFASLVA
jgi:hypothetical protein